MYFVSFNEKSFVFAKQHNIYRLQTNTESVYFSTHFFYKKLRLGLSTQSFLAFRDFEYSKFLKSFLTFFLTLNNSFRTTVLLG